MTDQIKFFRHPFALWMAANFAGFGLLGLAVLFVPGWLANAGFIGSILVISIPVSIAQWLVLRKTVSYSWLWILAMPVGLLLGILLLSSIPESVWQIVDDESIVALAGGYLVVGFLVGIPQWLLLRMRFENASLWLVASALAPALGLALVLFTNLIDWSELISYILIILIYGTVTGYLLSRWMSKIVNKQTNVLIMD